MLLKEFSIMDDEFSFVSQPYKGNHILIKQQLIMMFLFEQISKWLLMDLRLAPSAPTGVGVLSSFHTEQPAMIHIMTL